mgnify:CR=1 FL=1
MFTNNFDPVAFVILSIEIRWYSLSYIFGIFFGWLYVKKFLIRDTSYLKLFDELLSYIIIGIIIGGRVGYVIFYNLEYYLNNIIEIFYVWNGGMSFHGGLIGVIIATYLFSKKFEYQSFIFLDLIAISAPIGIFFGRLANFINSELIGKATNGSWGVIFIKVDEIPRHPSQIYEAVLEGLLLFFILNIIYFKKNYKIGKCSYLFLILYGVFRIISEFFREPDKHIGYIIDNITIGMILSLIMIFAGIYAYNKKILL